MSTLNTLKVRVVLQGSAKFRDGRKWKKRFCLLALSPRTPDAMHFYVTKSYDEFTPYRNHGCMIDVQPPAQSRLIAEGRIEDGPHSGTHHIETGLDCLSTRAGGNIGDSNIAGSAGLLVNTAVDTCTSVSEATAAGLSAATNLASSLNGPAPLDEITGFESGCHMDKESNIIVLLGSASAYVIALEGMDEMFRWAETMSHIMTDNLFRVTLRQTEGGKLSPGLQGSLHVQHWRLCLIGEPSAGCKFICSWRLDTIEQAHTMTALGGTVSAAGTFPGDVGSGTGFTLSALSSATTNVAGVASRGSFAGDGVSSMSGTSGSHQRVSLGNLSMLSASGSLSATSGGSTVPSGRSGTGSSVVSTRPKHLLVLEANHSAGKGRGTHTFELDGGSLPELTFAIEQLMALRYNPHGVVSRHLPSNQPLMHLGLHSTPTESLVMLPSQRKETGTTIMSIPDLGQSKDVGLISSSYSSDASGSRHSTSPAQRFSSIIKSSEPSVSSPRRQSPLTLGPITSAAMTNTNAAGVAAAIATAAALAGTAVTTVAVDVASQLTHVYGQSVPVGTSGNRYQYYNLARPYSNLVSSSSSLSPPEGLPSGLCKHTDAFSRTASNSKSKRPAQQSATGHASQSSAIIDPLGLDATRSSAMRFAQQPGDSLVVRSASPQESESLLTDEVGRHLSHSVFISSQSTRGCLAFPHAQSVGRTTNWSGSGGSGQRADDVCLSGYPPAIGCGDHHLSDGILLLGEEHQPNVAHVASGVIISKNPLNPHPTNRHSTGNGGSRRNTTATAAPPLPPPLPDSARARHEARTTAQLYQTLPANFPSTTSTPIVADGPRPILDETDGEEAVPSETQKSLSRPCRRHQTAGSYQYHRHPHQHQSHHNCRRLVPVASDASVVSSYSGPCPVGPSGVFTADEDLWDTDADAVPPVTSDSSSAAPVSLSVCAVPVRPALSVPLKNQGAPPIPSSIWPVSASSHILPTDLALFEPSSSKLSSVVRTQNQTTGDSSGTSVYHCNCNPKSREVLERQDYRVYRYRCRQYRVCMCSVLQTRSISSDASLVLELGTEAHLNLSHHRSRHSVPSQSGRTGTRLTMAGVHSYEDVDLERDSCPPSTSSWEAEPLDSVRLAAGDTLSDSAGLYCTGRHLHKRHLVATAGRTKPLHWLLHRKHSKSHDCLSNSDANTDKIDPTVHPVSFSVTESHLDSRHQSAEHACSDATVPAPKLLRLQTLSPSPLDSKHFQLILRCPRHGVQPYRPWITLFPPTVLSRYLCSYCRKRTLRLRPSTIPVVAMPTKHSRRCVLRDFTQPAVIGSSSVLLNLRHMLQLRRRTREPKRSSVSFGEQLESSSPSASLANRSHTHAEAEMANDRTDFVDPKRVLRDEPPGQGRLFSSTSSSPKHSRWRCEHHSRSLHSVTLACSEPSVSHSAWPTIHGNRSRHSSLSSLLTCRSYSASSSLSAYQPASFCPGDAGILTAQPRKYDGKTSMAHSNQLTNDLISGRRGSIDLLAETRSCSLCDTDDLSGSLYDDCCLVHDSIRRDVSSGSHTGDGLIGTTCYPHTRSHHHNLFVDCSPGRTSDLPTGHNSSVDPGIGDPVSHAQHQSISSGKLSTPDRRTLSLCNPMDSLHSPSHQLTSPTRPIDSSCLDNFYTPPATHHHPMSYSRRASTLPSTRMLRSRSERSDNAPPSDHRDSVEEVEVEGEGEDELVVDGLIRRSDSQPHPGRTVGSVAGGGTSGGLDRLLSRFVYATTVGRRHARYSTMTTTGSWSSSICPSPIVAGGAGSGLSYPNRKLSSQSDAGMVSHLVEEVGADKFTSADRLTTMAEVPNYCNLVAGQRGISPDMPTAEFHSGKLTTGFMTPFELEHKPNMDLTSSCYVNLPPNGINPLSATAASAPTATPSTNTSSMVPTLPTSTGSLTTRFKHLVQSLHHPNSSNTGAGGGGSTHGGVLSGTNSTIHNASLDPQTASKSVDSCTRQPSSRGKPLPSRACIDAISTTAGVISSMRSTTCAPSPSATVGGLSQELFAVPAEVRDPSRNYAIVDLRPSPASSVCANTELSLGASYHQLPNSRIEEITSAGSSAASIGFSTSTSTGSDCTSDAATLTSDTVDGYAGSVNVNYANPPRPHPGSTGPTDMPPRPAGSEFARRRHSHSLSSAVSDSPVLNYVHVIAATAPLSTPNATRRDGCSTVSEPIVCSIPEHTDSHSSSSGLGGLASHSITPPLAPASSASFGEIFTSRSMTSSATSSGEGGNVAVDAGFQSYSPPDAVAYTLIDITRTMALGELSGDMIEQQQQQQEQQHSTAGVSSKTSTANSHFRWSQHKPAADRSVSVRKSLSRSIRSIRRGNQKKPSVFLNNNG
ncbi:hypothetical protein FGIG_06787 [Fasciola gigantica]|uniref:PH domain-containing protein n=1 Tax=Fasciola gigantica TaxID=46835 RepID=A0A504YUT5_FASGI|nr:hypothetical protein FGIG_06787 [Fasciola gigantica]